MKDVTIRYYGLFEIRKRTYLVLQCVVLGLCGIWLIAGLLLKLWSPFIDPQVTPMNGLGIWDYVLILGIVVTVAETLDIIFALRAFRRKEEEENRQLGQMPMSAPQPADPGIQTKDDYHRM
jgi:hypothetical protein